MYVRNTSFSSDTEKDKGIPENYSGYAMSARPTSSEGSEEIQDKEEFQSEGYEYESSQSKEAAKAAFRHEAESDYAPQKENGLFSGLFEKMGIKGVESSDITVLIIALLLLSGENDDYIWILLLLLLLVK